MGDKRMNEQRGISSVVVQLIAPSIDEFLPNNPAA